MGREVNILTHALRSLYQEHRLLLPHDRYCTFRL